MMRVSSPESVPCWVMRGRDLSPDHVRYNEKDKGNGTCRNIHPVAASHQPVAARFFATR